MREALKFLPRVGRRPICKLIVFMKWIATYRIMLATPHRKFVCEWKGERREYLCKTKTLNVHRHNCDNSSY